MADAADELPHFHFHFADIADATLFLPYATTPLRRYFDDFQLRRRFRFSRLALRAASLFQTADIFIADAAITTPFQPPFIMPCRYFRCFCLPFIFDIISLDADAASFSRF